MNHSIPTDFSPKQRSILYELSMILETANSINTNLSRSIDLVHPSINLESLEADVRENTHNLKNILQLLGTLTSTDPDVDLLMDSDHN
ncbi:hypothetical protein PSN45_002669 [Yamadazyma tenuis]|uniref:uncharacterized protein n=1 Tax=Candida tenuis TaxID=2315449 RepID=UPI0027A68CC5|nr:hypothetical protein PSN45_002669 [Yamadazyma tenuis]